MKSVVHIHIGTDLPDYFWKTVRQTRRFHTGIIYLVIPEQCMDAPEVTEFNCRAVSCQSFEKLPKINELNSVSFLNKYGSGDFWHVTMQRLFVLEELMIQEQLSEVIHLENDVTIYFNPERLFSTFNTCFMNSTAVVPLGPSEGCTAALLYADGVDSLGKITTRMIELLKLGEKAIMNKLYRSLMVHEMMLLGIIHKEMPEVLKMLPIAPQKSTHNPRDLRRVKPMLRLFARLLDRLFPIKFSAPETFSVNNYYDKFNGVFDPLSIGLFIGGHSSAHKNYGEPVIHKNHWLAPDLFDGNYDIVWREDKQGRRCPFIKSTVGEQREWKLFNIHVHNKKIEDFV